ncbi:MAG: M48 family metalloprotease [Pseudomonadota bacterium]
MEGFTIFRRLTQAVFGVSLCLAPGLAASVASAQGLIRDAEVERTLDRISAPILRAAGLGAAQVNIFIVNDPRLNAFVAGGNNIFIHTGLMQKLQTVDQLRSVIAHETGHISGGHLARRNERIRRAQGSTALGVLLALGAAVGGAPEAGVAIGSLSGEAAFRQLLAHDRAEESSADQAGLSYMVAAGADPRAILEVMALFRGQEITSGRFSDPYLRTHPLWTQRLRQLEDRVANAPRGAPPPADLVYWHARMVAKLDGFLENPRRTLAKYKDDTTDIGALARAIAYHRHPDPERATATLQALLAARPDDPFYTELAGQFALENGNADAAVTAYRTAAQLAPDEPLILSGLGRALVALDTDPATREAVEVLTRARRLDKADARALRNLALAQARLGNEGQASLLTSERMLLLGRLNDAAIHATRAARALPQGSPGWRQAEDILRTTRRASRAPND